MLEVQVFFACFWGILKLNLKKRCFLRARRWWYLALFSTNNFFQSFLFHYISFAPEKRGISTLPQDRFLCFSSAKQCFLVLFCQPNRTFSCSRVLLFPCSPLRTMVKNVVKTRTSKKHKWSPKNRSKHQDGSSSRKQKTGREKMQCGQPKSSRPKDVVRNNRNRVVKPCGRNPLRAGKQTPTSRAFLLPPVSYCNLEIVLCQVLKFSFPLPK